VPVSIPHHKISYAQNFEDLVLAGLLKDVVNGFYVDVGANHDELDSVTKIFYDKGWTGINIEPNELLCEQLNKKRPHDINLQIGLGSVCGTSKFNQYESLDGLSTFSERRVSEVNATWPDALVIQLPIEISTLATVLNNHCLSIDIHFLKIDVEGLELEVVIGSDWKKWRPWVLCIERSQVTTQIDELAKRQTHARTSALERFLNCVKYEKVFFDGINDFYLAEEKLSLWEKFDYGSDVILNGVPVNYIFINHINKSI